MQLRSIVRAMVPYVIRNHLFEALKGQWRPPGDLSLPDGYLLSFPTDLGQITAEMLEEADIDVPSLRRRVDQGDLLGVVVHRGLVVHRTLVQTRDIAAMEGDPRAFPLGSGQAYVHYCQTSSRHRGLQLYPLMLAEVLRWLGDRPDHRATLIACNVRNAASVRGILRAGFVYRRSSRVFGVASGRIRLRRWYQDVHLGKRP